MILVLDAGNTQIFLGVYEREKLLVENSIRDFANLGFWEVDGRVK